MATRVVEGKKPYTGGEAIDINQNKVISLKLRDENNLIIYDSGDDEIYVDLQLPDGIEPLDAFPVGVTTGRVLVADDWDVTGTLICAKTTSGDNIKILYGDNGTLWIDNGTGTFKQIYFKADVDLLISTLTTYINTELAKKQNGVTSDTAPSNPSEGDLWYDTVNDALKVYNGSTWVATGGGGGGDVQVSTQANNIFTAGMKIWGGTQSDYQSLTPDSNTAYLLLADQPSPPSPGWQPGVNTIAYWKLDGDLTDELGNYDGTATGGATITYEALPGDSNVQCVKVNSSGWNDGIGLSSTIWTEWGTQQTSLTFATFMKLTTANSHAFLLYATGDAGWCVTNILYNYQDGLGLGLGNNGENDDNVSYTLNTNTRYSVVWTYDHTTRLKSYYVNGVLVGSVIAQNDYNTNATGTHAYLARINNNTCLSNTVLETNTAWTQQEAELFHDTFKSLYGIS